MTDYNEELMVEFDYWVIHNLKRKDFKSVDVCAALEGLLDERQRGDWFTKCEWDVVRAVEWGMGGDRSQAYARIAQVCSLVCTAEVTA